MVLLPIAAAEDGELQPPVEYKNALKKVFHFLNRNR
jgi:hypothetical protein